MSTSLLLVVLVLFAGAGAIVGSVAFSRGRSAPGPSAGTAAAPTLPKPGSDRLGSLESAPLAPLPPVLPPVVSATEPSPSNGAPTLDAWGTTAKAPAGSAIVPKLPWNPGFHQPPTPLPEAVSERAAQVAATSFAPRAVEMDSALTALIGPPAVSGASRPLQRVLAAELPADLAEEVAKVPRRRRDDHLLAEEPMAAPARPQAELPPGYTDPITGLPLAEAMRAEIEQRASDLKTFTVVVCHPIRAVKTPSGAVSVSSTDTFDETEQRVFANTLRDMLRQKDIVGRYDDRLFLLFLPRCQLHEVRIVMDRIRSGLQFAQLDQLQWVDVSFGAGAGRIGESVDGPLREAYADLLQRNAGPAWFLEA